MATAGGAQPRWRRDGGELFYVAPGKAHGGDGQGTERLVRGGRHTATFRDSTQGRDVTADGQRFLVNTLVEGTESPITLIVNWPALLRK